ncbi:hypothetical protein NC661_07530 [Aquibacillus koreensis]|uniref:Uncharacterized protein n=1 Tax=Aquibacillus koreensis TaxID=279446 RepID=A0A9X4AJ96_9BACI|nr:hypothetical protein [Aquibacillus koreensis]MCT2535764.1 hypothetical protein [Aquibacillus koreensis]MDC3420220.1 hypothetical protein [Aquibacillus koreensis]
MKKVIVAIATLAILVAVNYGITILFNQNYIDFSFVVGMLGAVTIRFFNSSGGYTSKNLEMIGQGITGIKMEQQDKKFEPNVAFYIAILYCVVALIVTFFYYKDYFI